MTREANIADRVARRMVSSELDASEIKGEFDEIKKALGNLNIEAWWEGEDLEFLIGRQLGALEDMISQTDTLDEESLYSSVEIARLCAELSEFDNEVRRVNRQARDMFAQIRNLGRNLNRKAEMLSQKCEKVVREIPR